MAASEARFLLAGSRPARAGCLRFSAMTNQTKTRNGIDLAGHDRFLDGC